MLTQDLATLHTLTRIACAHTHPQTHTQILKCSGNKKMLRSDSVVPPHTTRVNYITIKLWHICWKPRANMYSWDVSMLFTRCQIIIGATMPKTINILPGCLVSAKAAASSTLLLSQNIVIHSEMPSGTTFQNRHASWMLPSEHIKTKTSYDMMVFCLFLVYEYVCMCSRVCTRWAQAMSAMCQSRKLICYYKHSFFGMWA